MKSLLRLGLALLLFALSLFIAFKLYLGPLLKDGLEQKLSYYPGDSVSIGELDLQIFPPGLSMEEVVFRIHRPAKKNMLVLEATLSSISGGGFNWWQAWRDDRWVIKSIEVGHGSLKVFLRPLAAADSTKQSSSAPPSLLVENIAVDSLLLQLQSDSLKIELTTRLAVQALSMGKAEKSGWQMGHLKLQSKKGEFRELLPGQLLRYEALEFDSQDSTLEIRDFELSATLSREEFDQRQRYRKSQLERLSLPRIRVDGLNLSRIPEGIFARKVTLDSAYLAIYSDQRKLRGPDEKLLPSALIAQMKFPLSIDTVQLRHGALQYEFWGKVSEAGLGRLRGDQIALKLFPLSNIGHSECADVKLVASMRLMKASTLALKVVHFADRPQHDFELSAHLNPVAFAAFDPVFYPSLGIKAKQGFCEGLRAHFRGNDRGCRGKLDIAYRELKLAFPADQNGNLSLGNELKEKAANLILVNHNNEMGDDNGHIAFERPPNLPFIGYWWSGLESGLIDALLHFKNNQ